jgi:hypothetical protein
MIGKAFFALVFGITLFLPTISYAATLSVTPKTGTFEVGDRVTYKVVVSGEQPLNAVAGTVTFPSSLFSIESVSKTGSILNFWVAEPTFSKGAGTVQFEGVSLSGFSGGTGTVVTVTLRAIKAGSGSVTFQSGQILANDGQGTDITGGLNGASFLIEPAKERPKAITPQPSQKNEPIIEREVTAPEVLRKAPEIRLGTDADAPAIFGFSDHGKAEVLLTFVPLDGQRLFITGRADEQGSFVLPVPRALRDGPYAVTAVMILSDGTRTDSSLPLTVEVGGVVANGLSYETTTYAALIALMALIPLFFYFLWRKLGPRRHVRQEIRQEIREAQDTLHKSFVLIREDVRKHRKKSEGRKSDGSVFADDVSDIEDSLDDAEVMIEKEIQDIAMVDIDEDK